MAKTFLNTGSDFTDEAGNGIEDTANMHAEAIDVAIATGQAHQ
ncbi:MAG: hypothetical protein ACYSWQ_26645 [Planctomycetota bacterium]|jgi:hypothetical protein